MTACREELTTTAKRRSADAPKLIHLLKGDLDWIVMKCLEKDRTRRYDSATGLAADLKRHLSNEPVVARPPNTAYRLQKAVRRNKLAFAAATGIAAALVFGVIGTTIGLVRAEKQRRAAEESQKLAEQRFRSARQFVDDVFEKVAPEFSDLIGASKAQEALARTSVTFLESLGDQNRADNAFQADLAELYQRLADALGGIYRPNSLGDYDNALRYAKQALAIYEKFQKANPNDTNWLYRVILTEGRIGTLLTILEKPDEALVHHRRALDLSHQWLKARPNDEAARLRVRAVNFHIGHSLQKQGRAKEALEQHYLPYARGSLDVPVDEKTDPDEAHRMWVAHAIVGTVLVELDRAAEALPYLQRALRWNEILVHREPNNARWARDRCVTHKDIGNALVAVGRFDEGITNLQTAVRLGESLAERDPSNMPFQWVLFEALRALDKGCAKQAAAPGTSSARQAGLWQQAIHALTRAEEWLRSPELQQRIPSLRREASDITQALNNARVALAKLAPQLPSDSSGTPKDKPETKQP